MRDIEGRFLSSDVVEAVNSFLLEKELMVMVNEDLMSVLDDESITILRSRGEIDEKLLDFFFILHLFRIAPYKIHGPYDEFKRYLNLLQWSALDANF